MTKTALAVTGKKAQLRKNEIILGGRMRFSPVGKYAFLLSVGGVSYGLVELVWRGYTHPSMVVTGGLCLTAIYGINEWLRGHSLLLRSAVCAASITGIELCVGVLVNCILKMDVWDYSGMRLQFLGQISFVYSVFWFILSSVALFLMNFCEKKGLKK